MSVRPHSVKGTGTVANGLTDWKCVGEISLYFRLEINILGPLSVHVEQETQSTCNINTEARSRNYCCRSGAISLTYFCVCARAGVGSTCTGVYLRACNLTNPACNAPPYCHLRLLWLSLIFQGFLTNGTIFGKKLLLLKCVLISLQLFLETFLILRRIQRDIVNVKTFSSKEPFIHIGF